MGIFFFLWAMVGLGIIMHETAAFFFLIIAEKLKLLAGTGTDENALILRLPSGNNISCRQII